MCHTHTYTHTHTPHAHTRTHTTCTHAHTPHAHTCTHTHTHIAHTHISLELFYFAADRLGTDCPLNPSSLVSLSLSFYAAFTRRESCFYSEHALSFMLPGPPMSAPREKENRTDRKLARHTQSTSMQNRKEARTFETNAPWKSFLAPQ